jgi:DASH complex subunit DAM1
MADLEANLLHMQLMHESLARFSESFASFLYGMNMNAFCVDFPEAPVLESFRRVERMETQERFGGLNLSGGAGDGGIDNTFAYGLAPVCCL